MRTTEESVEQRWGAVLCVEGASDWTRSVLTNNTPLIQSRIIKWCKITAWNWFLLPSFTLLSVFTRLFHAMHKRHKSCTPLYSGFVALHEISGEYALAMKRKRICEGQGSVVGLEKTWFWCNQRTHTLTFSCAGAHPSSYVSDLKSWEDNREYNHERQSIKTDKAAGEGVLKGGCFEDANPAFALTAGAECCISWD